ncbi:MAG: nuclear transport factor 2 family protein [Ruegeria sp.]
MFAHTEYDFSRRNIGFEVFRFEDGQAIEHWDNIQKRQGPNLSGRSMVDGPVEARDLHLTEENREFVRSFVQNVLVDGKLNQSEMYINAGAFAEHNPRFGDDLTQLRTEISATENGQKITDYQKLHRVLAQGDFVLTVCEGYARSVHSAYYDLFRVENEKIVEHWDTVEKIAPRGEWKNDNGKF